MSLCFFSSSSFWLPFRCPSFAFADSFHFRLSPAVSHLLLSVSSSLNLPGACLLQRLLPHLNPILFQYCSSLSITPFQYLLLFPSPGLWGTRIQSCRAPSAVVGAGYQGKSFMCGWNIRAYVGWKWASLHVWDLDGFCWCAHIGLCKPVSLRALTLVFYICLFLQGWEEMIFLSTPTALLI